MCAALSEPDCRELFALFDEHYDGATWENFRRDLSTKGWVIVVRDEANRIQGFTTLAIYESLVRDQPIGVIFCGDTIVRPAFWGRRELLRRWMKTVLAQTAQLPQLLYWFLICSGYKTYRTLPVFAKEFYPCYAKPTPPEVQALMHQLATERFGADYCPERGIIRFSTGATPLKCGVADVTPERMQDPHIAFFVAHNPGYIQGDELVCLAQFHFDNFSSAARWMAR